MVMVKTREWRFVDKSAWSDGPWQDEPDKMQWQDETTGLPCLAVRGPGGHWCGYVGVSEGHPWFGLGYSECREGCESCWGVHSPDGQTDVHGGLTFADFCAEKDPEHGICHVTEPGAPERVWWFGFDCAHSGDLSPKWADRFSFSSGLYEVYRSLEYVRGECSALARQLEAARSE